MIRAEGLHANATVRWRCCAACRSKWRAARWYRSSAPAARARRRCCRSSGRSRAPTAGASRSAASIRLLCRTGVVAFPQIVVGFVFQFHHLLPEFTAFENVCLPGLIGGRDRREVGARAAELLDLMGLAARRDHKPAALSGGEQRAAIARALINSPSGAAGRRTFGQSRYAQPRGDPPASSSSCASGWDRPSSSSRTTRVWRRVPTGRSR